MDNKVHMSYNAIGNWLVDLKPLQREMIRAARTDSRNESESAAIMRSYIIATGRMLEPIYGELEKIKKRTKELASAEQAIEDAQVAFEQIERAFNS